MFSYSVLIINFEQVLWKCWNNVLLCFKLTTKITVKNAILISLSPILSKLAMIFQYFILTMSMNMHLQNFTKSEPNSTYIKKIDCQF